MVVAEADSVAEVSEEPAAERLLARLHRWLNLAYWIVAAVAIALVTAQAYSSVLYNASLRYDEINVVVSIIERSYAQLHPPLDYLQSAPIGWLWLEKLGVDLFGNTEIVLRFPSVIATAGALTLTAFLARRMLPPLGALLTILFVATNYYVAYYAYDAKPYALDMVCSVALVLSALAARRRAMTFWIVATVTSFFSYPAVFCAAALALVLGVERLLRAGGWRPAIRAGLLFSAGAIPWLAMVAFVYVFSLRSTAGNDFLYAYFARSFPGAGIGGRLGWLATALFTFGGTALTPGAAWLASLVLVGAVVLVIRRRWDAALLIAPVAIGFVLAGLRIYPMADRLSMYAVPVAAVLLFGFTDVPRAAVARLLRRQWSPWPVVACLLALVLAAPAVWRVEGQVAGYYREQSADSLRTWTQTRQLFVYLKQQLRPGDVLLASPTDEVAFRYYGKRVGLPAPTSYVLLQEPGPACGGAEIRPLVAAASRIWMITSFGNNVTPYARLEKVLGAFGPVAASLHLAHGRLDAYRVVNRQGPDVRDPALAAATRGLTCLKPMRPPFPFPPPR
ncbi:ArnT family glycosyltransferase [Fodinicola acaciae]|uniref:ArnT family glycosyltransferase n=1 Tax=Fodinicola acaciae TaxID=2681555 RepID=UPI0013D84F29|nr:glycosyltransferase family 39 protein [Fodinicola acaciae]